MASPVVEITFSECTMMGKKVMTLQADALSSVHKINEACALENKYYSIYYPVTCQPFYEIHVLHQDGKLDNFNIYGTAERTGPNVLSDNAGLLPSSLAELFCDLYEIFERRN